MNDRPDNSLDEQSDIPDALKSFFRTEQLYGILAETMPAGIMLCDRHGKQIYVNKQASKLTGYSVQELMRGVKICHPDDSDFVLAALHKALEGESGSNLEYRVITKQGDTRWVSHSWSPVMADGKPRMVVSVVKDITESKRAQEAIREAEEKYRLLAENASDIIWQMDLHGMFTYVSAAVKDFGYEPSEWMGHSILDFLPEHEKATARRRMRRDVQARSHQRRYEVQMLRKNGTLVWMEVSVGFATEGGTPVRIQGIARDISERKAAEEALRKAHNDITRAYDLQKEFLNNVTHEVRTPLTAVQGYIQMILEGAFGPVPDEQASLLKKALASSDHLLAMVSEVLEMARLKSGANVLRPRASNPCAIINSAVSTITPQAMRKGLSLKVNLPKRDPIGMYDGDKLSAIVTNLLSNAVKFTEKGEIDLSLSCRDSGVEVIVADTGMGISSSQLNSIFDEFQQLDYPRKHKPTGFGIGLAIVAAMVEAINGTIVVSSRKGRGTAFTLFAPALDAQTFKR